MMPLAGKPLIRWTIDALKKSGIENVFVVVGRDDKGVKAYLGDEVTYLTQEDPKGTADAIGKGKGHINGPFICINGDVAVDEAIFPELIRFFEEKDANILTVLESPGGRSYGVVETGSGDKITGLVEKPATPKSNLINAGIYIFKPEIFEQIGKTEKSSRGEYEITDSIMMADAYAFKYGGFWQDLGKPWDMLAANEFLMKKLKGEVKGNIEPGATLKGEVYIGEGSRIRAGAYIRGPVRIGKDCVIGPNCYIRPYSSIGDDVHIGNAVEIKNTIIMDHTNVPHLSYVGDSLIGEDCNLGAGTNVANLRFDDAEVKLLIKGSVETSGRRKFGCVIGDGVKTGINVSIMPGRKINPHKLVKPNTIVSEDVF